MQRVRIFLLLFVSLIIIGLTITIISYAGLAEDKASFLPVVTNPPVELRALWVTRWDWASGATEATIDEIVQDAAAAGFNALFFQVRGEADALYRSNLEPWSRFLTGTFGQDPGWDPLDYMVRQAHAKNIQVHAYINVYPIWLGCDGIDANTTPQHLYYKLQDIHGTSQGKLRSLQWNQNGAVICGSPDQPDYQRASPASLAVDDHLLVVAADLVTRYDVDGIHLDHIRYASGASCDPVSLCRYNGFDASCNNALSCNFTTAYKEWQIEQVNGTVRKFYEQIVPLKPGLWLSAAVWPIYSTGRNTYYQDSKIWLQSGYIDSISPMIYLRSANTAADWANLVDGFQSDPARQGRFIVPGIDATDSFDGIAARIEAARQLDTAGHAIFSYGAMKRNGYFDLLAQGPYAIPALPPTITWHP